MFSVAHNNTIRRTIVAVGAIVLFASNVAAQDAPVHKPSWQFSVNSGTVVPTGAQRDAIKRGGLTAAQLTYDMHPSVAIVTTVGWARSRDIATVGDPKLDVFTYDIGAELRAPRMNAGRRTGTGAHCYSLCCKVLRHRRPRPVKGRPW